MPQVQRKRKFQTSQTLRGADPVHAVRSPVRTMGRRGRIRARGQAGGKAYRWLGARRAFSRRPLRDHPAAGQRFDRGWAIGYNEMPGGVPGPLFDEESVP